MTLNEFVKKYNCTKVDFDNYAGAQCVDLFRQYTKDVLGVAEHTGPCTSTGGAKDLFNDYLKMPIEKKYFTRQGPKERVLAGDVLIWGSGEYGHVAIALGTLGDDYIVFEQDGFKQDGAKINLRNKRGLLGTLRRR